MESFEDCLDFLVTQVSHSGENNVATECDKKWDLVHKKDVDRHRHDPVQGRDLNWYLYDIGFYHDRLGAGGLPF